FGLWIGHMFSELTYFFCAIAPMVGVVNVGSTSHFLVGRWLMGPPYTGSPGAPRRPGLPVATLHCLFWGISYRRAPLTEITWNKQKRFLLQGAWPPTTRVPNRGRRPGTGEASWRPPARAIPHTIAA